MQKLSENFLHTCREICKRLSEIENPEKNQIKNEIKEICSKYSLERLPRNSEILSAATEEQFPILQKLLKNQSSGVTVIAIMQTFACPHGRCNFCPGGTEINTPTAIQEKNQ